MKVIGLKLVRIADLSNPEEFLTLVNTPEVLSRASSIRDHGMLHEPIVRHRDMRLLTGRRRVAAVVKLGLPEVKVKLVDCDDKDAKVIEAVENLERWHDPEQQAKIKKQLLDIYTEEESTKPPKRDKAGRPVGSLSPRGRARARLAEARGVKPEAIRRAEYRQKERERKQTLAEVEQTGKPVSARYTPPEPTINVLGMDVSPEFVAQVATIQTYIADAAARVRGARSAMLQVRKLPFSEALHNRLDADLQQMESDLKACRPESVCPYCKTLAGVQEACNGCVSTGWVTKAKLDNAPKVLLAEGAGAAVQYEGNIVPVSDLIDTQGAAAEAEVAVEEDLF